MRSPAAIRQKHKRIRAQHAAQQALTDAAKERLDADPDDMLLQFRYERHRVKLHSVTEKLELSTARRDELRITPMRDPWEDTADMIMWRQAENRPLDFPRTNAQVDNPLGWSSAIGPPSNRVKRPRDRLGFVSPSDALEKSSARRAIEVAHAEKMHFNALVRQNKQNAARKLERASTPEAIERARKRAEREQVKAEIAQRRAAREAKTAQANAVKAEKLAKKERANAALIEKRAARAELTRQNVINRANAAKLKRASTPEALERARVKAEHEQAARQTAEQSRKEIRERTLRQARRDHAARQSNQPGDL